MSGDRHPETQPPTGAGAADAASGAGPAPLACSAATHPGTVRRRNEDRLVQRPDLGLWAVADGAGGHGAGDVASAAVAAALEAIPPGHPAAALPGEVRARLAAAHAALRRHAAALGPGRVLATTIVALVVAEGRLACLWAGDSRAYRLRAGALRRLTRDHSLVQQMVDEGRLTEAQAERHPQSHVILRAIGAGEAPPVLDEVADAVLGGDTLLLCSDGLPKALPEEALEALLRAGAEADAVVAAALARRARDNLTAIILRPPAAARGGAGPMPDRAPERDAPSRSETSPPCRGR